ncbi:MAG: hypothetical protein J2P37_02200 [Ktedonobacteraceae bacterium]|nr:hypothetical protein [Ktedonobacteraceae bacterium]
MRRNSSGLFKHLPILAMVFALALTFLFAEVASAATTSSQSPASAPTKCLTASPPTQTVKAGQEAKVTATIYCYPPQSGPGFLYLVATWGDGTTSQYLLCGEVACMQPPVVINTSHIYQPNQAGAISPITYHPTFCVETLPASSSTPECVSVEIVVV